MIKNTVVETGLMMDCGVKKPKSCKELIVDLSAYYDGELQGEALEEVERHLANCDACKESMTGYNQISHALHGLVGKRDRRKSMVDEVMDRIKANKTDGLIS